MEERECQTKDTDCILAKWRPGDLVDPQLKWIIAGATCSCTSEKASNTKFNNMRDEYYFSLKILLDSSGKLTENYYIIEDE